MFQDYLKLNLSVRENIGVGRVDFIDDLSCIQAAAQASGAHGYIRRLPSRYESELGYGSKATKLSGGQEQKLAISRAFLRAMPLTLRVPRSSRTVRTMEPWETDCS